MKRWTLTDLEQRFPKIAMFTTHDPNYREHREAKSLKSSSCMSLNFLYQYNARRHWEIHWIFLKLVNLSLIWITNTKKYTFTIMLGHNLFAQTNNLKISVFFLDFRLKYLLHGETTWKWLLKSRRSALLVIPRLVFAVYLTRIINNMLL